ncbi:hypothetical protein L8S92_16885 [Enterobacter asburiae]|uniref:hypothetical protein n=1 Tax=Enterobacter asburiae TaxID=61645 RepID=UPI0020057BB3|nr:hypothetical protein [Enterobacter asburiae]MCK6996651.1 hypothetical protein [Enterobacter asburiae]
MAKLLNYSAGMLTELPDFSNDEKVFVFSDFGGEHSSAKYLTYSFLICSGDKQGVFQENVKSIRAMGGMNSPYKEYSFKELKYNRIRDTVKDYFFAVDHFIHGLVVTVSIEKEIANIFSDGSKSSLERVSDLLVENGCGEWKNKEAEKVLRIIHIMSFYISLLCHSGQKILWMCDNDSINEDGKKRDFSSVQKLLMKCLPMYSENTYELFGFCRSFKRDHLYGDFLSVTDFAAGIVQEILSAKFKGVSSEIDESKLEPLKWIGKKSRFLSKLNVRVFRDGDQFKVSNDLFELIS